ncbi:hypothetical protein QBC47DRAFT_442112 [Echria macrotheca]|uniref:DUF6536 domain-containing protein n=1 Tax=Echria macrotheca TaxID=438768 RepID=A0AAJ0BFG4_9PEZI|nr:hypothetical protein QBC47DRAFT_442112 [Echria macrotheca]
MAYLAMGSPNWRGALRYLEPALPMSRKQESRSYEILILQAIGTCDGNALATSNSESMRNGTLETSGRANGATFSFTDEAPERIRQRRQSLHKCEPSLTKARVQCCVCHPVRHVADVDGFTLNLMATTAAPDISPGTPDLASQERQNEQADTKRPSSDKVAVSSVEEDAAASFRVSRFAEKNKLSWWFPQILDDEHKSRRIWWSRRSRAIVIQIVVIGIIFCTNLGLTIFAFSRYGSDKGVGLIYEGDCEKVRTLDQWIHLLINLLGTGMLSASNYCMQLQAAPTRANIDRAHKDNRWLDIGIPSLRNLGYISNWRRLSWALLALSSVPIHLIYNSAVFQSLSSYDYTVAVVKDSFLDGASWNLTAAEERRQGSAAWDVVDDRRLNPPSFNYTDIIHGMQVNAMHNEYVERDLSSCFALYDDYWQPQGNVVVLVKNASLQSPPEDSLLMYASVIPRMDDWAKNMWALENGTGPGWVARSEPLPQPITKWYVGPHRYEVSRCLVQPPEQLQTHCRFEYSPGIMFTIVSMNFVKALIMLAIWVLRRWQEPLKAKTDPRETEVLYTLGDAIASFMRFPDETTRDMGLASKYDFEHRRRWETRFVKQAPSPPSEPRVYSLSAKRWHSSVSLRRWLTAVFIWLLIMATASILLGRGFVSLRHRSISITMSSLWELGFGSLTPYTYLVINLPRSDPAGLISNVLIANLPQLLLSFIYIIYNIMLSAFLVQLEFSRMYKVRKPLRVSEPTGIQRSSYFISLPLRYGIPLYASSGVMHWLLSQSLFLARITAFHPSGEVDALDSFSTCGYSPIAIIISMMLGIAFLAVVVGLGFRRYDGVMRMVATNSRAISAACHVLEEDREDGYLLPVQWGVVSMTKGVGKCTFTTAPRPGAGLSKGVLKLPQEGMRYI